MRKILYFFVGVLLMVTAFLSLMVTGVIFDTGDKTSVEPKFFQPENSYEQRPGVPAAPTDLGDSKMRDLLITKYVIELFYVTPDVNETARRIEGLSSLRRTSSGSAFKKWLDNIAPEIEELSKDGVLRAVSVTSILPRRGSDKYWTVGYQLKTWSVPNDFSVEPQITNGIVDLYVRYAPGLRSKDNLGGYTVTRYLELENTEPSAVFNFNIEDVVFDEKDGSK